jgi:DNA-directed RNA polymerase specialized sigma24 family protein
MDSPTIRHLRTERLVIGTTPQSAAACHRLAQCEPVVDRLKVDNLAESVAALSLSSGRLSRNEAAEVIMAMLRSADAEALIPWVLALLRRFDLAEGPWCDLDAFHADAVSALWELTIRWSGTQRPYAAGDLLSGVRTRLRTLQSSERRHRSRQGASPAALDALPASTGRTGEELLATALAEATGHGLKVADAAVLYATRVLGMSVTEVAQLAGLPPGHLRRRRRIAINRLVA